MNTVATVNAGQLIYPESIILTRPAEEADDN